MPISLKCLLLLCCGKAVVQHLSETVTMQLIEPLLDLLVGLSVGLPCLSVTLVSPTKTAESVDMPFAFGLG